MFGTVEEYGMVFVHWKLGILRPSEVYIAWQAETLRLMSDTSIRVRIDENFYSGVGSELL